MKLVIFDLDSTLTKTFAIDEQCFVQAFADALGINAVNRNWSEYEHVTDSGVLQEVFRKSLGRAPEASEVSAFVQCFVGSLNHHYCKSIDDFGEVPGTASMLVTLKENSDWGAAIATGSWEQSARFKMRAAGIDADPLPAAFAQDGPSRESIVQAAITRASVFYRQSAFEKVVSVGDAMWDLWTARRLGLPFVGVAHEERARNLRRLGASHVIENFLDCEHCLQCLEGAAVPDAEAS